jgi:hypothetical protein
MDPAPVGKLLSFHCCPDRLAPPSIDFDELDKSGAAQQGLKSQGACAGVQVQHPLALDAPGAEDRKERAAHHSRRRAQP